MQVYVARQAVFDCKRNVYGYELLYRTSSQSTNFDAADSQLATRQVVANGLFAIGMENLVGRAKVFLNFDQNALESGWRPPIPAKDAVVEILETVDPTPAVIDAVAKLRSQGFLIALDDFVMADRFEPLLALAHIIKIDIRHSSLDEQEELILKYRPRGIRMLAEKVETYDEFEAAKRQGFELFQGYFFARPQLLSGRQIPAVKIACLRLLREVQKPDIDLIALERRFHEDASFAYKLLRYVNSALFAFRDEIRSIKQALAALGEVEIRKWVALVTLPRLSADKPSELAAQAMIRGRFCQSVADLAKVPSEAAFLVGLFSHLDGLVDRPMHEALSEIHVSTEIQDALLGIALPGNKLSVIYKLTRRQEMGDWDGVEAVCAALGISADDATNCYVEAVTWTNELLRSAVV